MRICKTCKANKVNSEFDRPERERVALACNCCKALTYEKYYGGVCKELSSKRLSLNANFRRGGDLELNYDDFENIRDIDEL